VNFAQGLQEIVDQANVKEESIPVLDNMDQGQRQQQPEEGGNQQGNAAAQINK